MFALLTTLAVLSVSQSEYISRDEAKASLSLLATNAARDSIGDAIQQSHVNISTHSAEVARLEGKASILQAASTTYLTKTQYAALMMEAEKQHNETLKMLQDMVDELKMSATPEFEAKVEKVKKSVAASAKTKSFPDIGEATTGILEEYIEQVDEAATASKSINKLHIWRGYCSKTASSGWQEYCLDKVDEDSGSPYFRADTATRFVALRSGFFRINLRYISNACSWGHVTIHFGNTYRYHGHNNDRGEWQDKSADMTYYVNAGEQFYVRPYSNCNNAYHAGADDGRHSRLEVIYMGK